MSAWRTAFGCTGKESTVVSGALTKTTWPGCRDGASAELTVIAGADHPWPGALERRASSLQGTPTQLLDATEEAWRFFKLQFRK